MVTRGAFLIDTNVLSELRRARGDAIVRRWMLGQPEHLVHVSVMTVFELEQGIARLSPTDPVRAGLLTTWLEGQVLPSFDGRVLAVDAVIARTAARLQVPGSRPPVDSFIAATALVHGLTLVTRNLRDFDGTGVVTLNPWLG